MALVRPYEDLVGNTYVSSYWRVVTINIASYAQNLNVVFYGWKDAASFAAGKAPIQGAAKIYYVTGQEFLALATSSPVGDTIYEVLAITAESYAIDKKDVPTEEKDEDGNPVMVSFFEGATQV